MAELTGPQQPVLALRFGLENGKELTLKRLAIGSTSAVKSFALNLANLYLFCTVISPSYRYISLREIN
jgi:hypothetical protein